MKIEKLISFIVFAFAIFLASSAYSEGIVTGKVTYSGPPVVPQPINFGAEKQCAEVHGDKMPVNEDLVINPNGTVKWALVRIQEDVPGDYPVPTDPVLIDQTGCTFVPHVSSVRAGQPVEFKNSDAVLHNVRGFSKLGQSFNVAQPIQGMKTKKTFALPEPEMPIKCDVHFWMIGYLHIMPNPFYAITGDDGTFAIKGLPAGTYTLELWHEKLGSQTQTITVKDGETETADFVLERK